MTCVSYDECLALYPTFSAAQEVREIDMLRIAR